MILKSAFRSRRVSTVAVALALSTSMATLMSPHATLASEMVTVNTHEVGVLVPSTAVGMNTAVYDGHLQDGAVPGLLRSVGTQLLRYPGGSTADVYHWQTNSITPGQGGYANPANSFAAVMATVVAPTGAHALITVNYGSNASGAGGGDPAEAAAWVRAANIQQHLGITTWEIGNEVYGNGYYGAAWETDLHADHSPTAYATNALAYIQAMKAVDPSIKVGLVLTAPGAWPDGLGPQQWNPTVLSIAGAAADFVSVHWYPQSPGSESDAGVLASTDAIGGMVAQLRSELTRYAGSHGAQMGIMVTETNSVSSRPGKQTTSAINGLFAVDDYLRWLQAGVQNVSWWDLHNGPESGNNNSPSLAGTTSYGDYGILSNGTGSEPAANTPLASYAGLQLIHVALTRGAVFVGVSCSDPALHAYALRQPGGQVALVLVNTDSLHSYTITPSINGLSSITSATATNFSPSTGITTNPVLVQGGTMTYAAQPDSAVVIQMDGTSTSSPPAVGATPTVAQPVSSSTPVSRPPVPTVSSIDSKTTMLGDFEGTRDGFTGNSAVTNMGPSTWNATVARGSSSLWVQYTMSTAGSEAEIMKRLHLSLGPLSQFLVSVYVKQPVTSGAGVQLRLLVKASNGAWYALPYRAIPVGTRTTVSWSRSGMPPAMTELRLGWRYATNRAGSGNEIWFDAVTARFPESGVSYRLAAKLPFLLRIS